jgi:hypothetical protein
VRPPRIEVVHHKLHHEIFGPLLLIIALDDKRAFTRCSACADCEHRHVGAVEHFAETERLVEGLADFEIFRGQKGPRQLRAARYRHVRVSDLRYATVASLVRFAIEDEARRLPRCTD